MLETKSLFGLILQLLPSLLWVVTLILLIISRKKFTLPDKPLSGKAKIFFVFIAVIFIGFNGYSIITAYYKAYHPDYEYDKTSEIVGFHIYKPSFIPGERVQDSKFFIWDKELAGKTNAVRAAYSTPLTKVLKGDKTKPIIITQAKMDTDFSLSQYVNSLNEKDSKQNMQIKPVTLSKLANQQAFIRERPFGNSNLVELDLITSDNILVTIVTLGETSDNLVKLAESLE